MSDWFLRAAEVLDINSKDIDVNRLQTLLGGGSVSNAALCFDSQEVCKFTDLSRLSHLILR